MKRLFAAMFLLGSVGFGAHTLFAQGIPAPNVPETAPRILSQIQSAPEQSRPDVPQLGPLPGQPGTIPERIQPPDATEEEMVISPEEIKRAQEGLKAKGHNPGAISGRMDAKTQEALREFQRANNLAATGVLDKKTAEKLGVTVPSETGSTPQQR